MKTSCPSKRYSEGRRTAWLRPLRNSFAVRGIGVSKNCGIYHSILQQNVTVLAASEYDKCATSYTGRKTHLARGSNETAEEREDRTGLGHTFGLLYQNVKIIQIER